MWPSFDVHKVMIEQSELSKKHDFFFLLNQIQTRLLTHSSKKPLCPENGKLFLLFKHKSNYLNSNMNNNFQDLVPTLVDTVKIYLLHH